MGKKKKDTKSKTKNKKQGPIEFTTEFPLEILRNVSEFLPFKDLINSILLVSKDSYKFVNEIIDSRREKLTDWSLKNSLLKFQYKHSKNTKIHSTAILNSKTCRLAFTYTFKDYEVAAVIDLISEYPSSHIFEYRPKSKSILKCCKMDSQNSLIVYSENLLEIYNIEQNILIDQIRIIKGYPGFSEQDNTIKVDMQITQVIYLNGILAINLKTSDSIRIGSILYRYVDNKLEYIEYKNGYIIEGIDSTELENIFLLNFRNMSRYHCYEWIGFNAESKTYMTEKQLLSITKKKGNEVHLAIISKYTTEDYHGFVYNHSENVFQLYRYSTQ